MNKPIGDRRLGRFMMYVLWPAFVMSAVAEGVFFSMIDPQELTIVGLHLADSREAAYTVGFFLFWALFSICSGLTYLLAGSPARPPDALPSPEDPAGQDKALIGR
ncbi:MAG TPA: hypothetical protein PK359_02225 [Burkholderiaceae bacterium]|jgi:hypothetical protein|nr:hypothetical protein [Burkholderiaceae bacterium]